MPSPSRSPRGSPPRRAALHERTESHTNEGAGSSLRIVGELEANVYGASPYPTKPSQMFPPSDAPSGQAFAHGSDSSRHTPVHESPYNLRKPSGTSVDIPEETLSRRGIPIRHDTQKSSTDVSFYTASIHDSLAPNSPPLDTSKNSLGVDQHAADNARVSDDIVELPSVLSRLDTTYPLASSNPARLAERLPAAKTSDTSLSSANSTGTMIVKKNRDGRKRASYSAFPNTGRPSSSKSSMSISPVQRPLRCGSDETPAPISPVSPSSPAFATTHERWISSVPEYANLTEANRGVSNLQYPTIKPASASGSWVKSSAQRTPRVVDRDQERWNPHLSTVPSEGTGSYSGGRASQSMWSPDSSRASQSSSNILNSRFSSDHPPLPRQSPELPMIPAEQSEPPPLPSSPPVLPSPPPPIRQRDITGSTIRVVDERDSGAHGAPNTLQAIPGSRDSEPFGPTSREKRGSAFFARPASRASFFKDSIPAWAKAYYARPNSSTFTKGDSDRRISTSTDKISLNIPPNRTRNRRRRSELGFRSTRPGELSLAEARGAPPRMITQDWSPHLWHDRTSLGRRRSIFKAPSVDEQAEGHALTKRNAQIALFALGFIFPPAWWLGSLLPLPPGPAIQSEKGKNASRHAQIIEDLEKQLGPIDEARYENARWWRNVNRVMAAIGLMIVAVIIALAVVSR